MELVRSSFNECKKFLTMLEKSGEYVLSKDSETLLDVVNAFSTDPKFEIFQYLNDDAESVGITSTFPNSEKGRISLGITYILPDYRGNGYGYEIRMNLLKILEKEGYEEVYTKTWESNSAMIHLNKKMGFNQIGSKKNDRINGDSTLKFLYRFDEQR